jgi:hypothetical protein
MKNYCVSTLSYIRIPIVILTLSRVLLVNLRGAEMKTVDDFRSVAAKAVSTTCSRKTHPTIASRFPIQFSEKVFLPIDPSTTLVTYFGHLNGYDAGYYGYAWADAIAADMATVFEQAKGRYLDRQAGLRLRHEIYEQGDARDVSLSIEKFLGRKQSIEPFLKKIGVIGSKETEKAPAGPSQESK